MSPFIICTVVTVLLIGGVGLVLALRSGASRSAAIRTRGRTKVDASFARSRFSERREWLEADFFKLGSQSGSPRGLRWAGCDFDNDVSFAIDKRTGELTALTAVGIQFEAIEGGEMEDVEAVANEKAATAVFRFDGQKWQATGKTVFNLSPVETIEYYQNELETIEI
ncbi:hypothetical protein ACFL2H_03000 [Planctomycetota bacterium]